MESLLSRSLLIFNVLMHVLAFSVDIRNNLLFISDSSLLFLDKSIGNSFQLGTNGVKMVVVVLDSVLFFLLNCLFKFVPDSSCSFRNDCFYLLTSSHGYASRSL